MKKLTLLLAVFCMVLMNTYATVVTVSKSDTIVTAKIDTVTANSTVGEVERLVDKYSGKISDVLTSLAQSLKVPADHVYKVFTNQYFYEGLISTCIFLFFFIMSIIILPIFISSFRKGHHNHYKKNDKQRSIYDDIRDNYTETAKGIGNIFGMVICSLLLIAMVIVLCVNSDAYMQIANPEFYTIQNIMSLIK